MKGADRWRKVLGAVALRIALVALAAPAAHAQGGAAEVFVGSELEEYLRYLQTSGETAPYPWSIRGFSPREMERIAPRDSVRHVWSARYSLRPAASGSRALALIQPKARMIYNSAFPFGVNDGAVWAGRGLTTVLEAGVAARYGPLSLVLAPTLFRAENAGFEMVDNGRLDQTRFGDGVNPVQIDLPQRFGDEAYMRLEPGQSTLRVDAGPVAIGVSTANQQWGPASEHPILLGHNAPGYLHMFAGTSSPLDVWIGKVHGRLVWGRLDQSDYTDVTGPERRRFMSGLVGVFTPRGLPGLELGAGRFFHTPWPEDGLTVNNFAKPLESLLKAYLPDRPRPDSTTIPDHLKSDDDNQLASVFARWVLPGGGFEVYGEFGREDHNFNLRDVAVQIDHHSAYMFGFRKLWTPASGGYTALRTEVFDAQPSHLLRVRAQYPFYIHAGARQGHTQRGQLLGSYAGYGGSGSILAFDRYSERGRWSVEWRRMQVRERYPHLDPLQGGTVETDTNDPDAVDVIHALGTDFVRFLGPVDLVAGVNGVYNLNRHFGDDAFNLNLVVGFTLAPRPARE